MLAGDPQEADVHHHVILSIVGVDQVPQLDYYHPLAAMVSADVAAARRHSPTPRRSSSSERQQLLRISSWLV
ncbi:hypothetical protein [Streptomyces sp. KR55]|uniref:hypothetical protein n=1 Tax=Streptomyces sp. KR55 TaxID=3457425 RepID=UPI003FD36F08